MTIAGECRQLAAHEQGMKNEWGFNKMCISSSGAVSGVWVYPLWNQTDIVRPSIVCHGEWWVVVVQDEEAECNTITRGDWKVAFVLLLTMWNGGWMLRLFSY